MITTLNAPKARPLTSRRTKSKAEPEPEPSAVTITRATVIDVGEPQRSVEQARGWLARAGEPELREGLAVLDRVLHAFRSVTADPYVQPIGRRQLLVARVGYGDGEQVADGAWSDALELSPRAAHKRRSKILEPQARLAAVLGSRERVLACEELTLRARLDLDQDRPREAALQLAVALDAALAELGADSVATQLRDRLAELRDQREPVAAVREAALSGPLSDREREAVVFTLGRIEAALRARAAAKR